MRLTIDNQDGLGAIDYSPYLDPTKPLTVQRQLNEPSRCTGGLVLDPAETAIKTPARKGRITITTDAGTTLFTGYLATEPVLVYAGTGTQGPVYRAELTGISDEWLLDRLGTGTTSTTGAQMLGASGTSLLETLIQRAETTAGATTAITVASNTSSSPRTVGVYSPTAGDAWSANAAAAAGATYSSYRVVNGQLSVSPAGATTHTLSDGDGTFSLAELSTSNVRELANDITLTGTEEPAAYVQEFFSGDGTTTVFTLSRNAFRLSPELLALDSFNEATFNTALWQLTDGGNHLTLGAGGLTVNGGNGQDGETTLSTLDVVEMGGSMLVTLGGVTLGASSAGMLAGFYSGPLQLENCFAGFRVRQSVSGTGSVNVLIPVINGAEVGTAFEPVSGHTYTLRLRLHCPEFQRVMQLYYAMADGVVETFGNPSGVTAPMDVVFDLIDEGVSSNTPATVLYDTAAAGAQVASSPATCTFCVVNALSLFGSVASVELTRPGSLWVVSTLPNGTRETRLIGTSGTGVDCEATYGTSAGTDGKVTFFAGRVPVAGETVAVFYRSQQRAVARLASASSIAAEATTSSVSIPGVSRWLGKVLEPAARSTADCESAAEALLAIATSRSASISGTCKLSNPAADIWPGDLLDLTSAGTTAALLVRSVAVASTHAVPELLTYKVAFANDWATDYADGLGMKLSETIAADALLPDTATNGPASVLANLPTLAPVAMSATAVQVDAGIAPPTGGGFEVRRRDNLFGSGVDAADLVLRSPVRSFSIPRASYGERFYIRMYDASTPPNYSRLSAALVLNTPVS